MTHSSERSMRGLLSALVLLILLAAAAWSMWREYNGRTIADTVSDVHQLPFGQEVVAGFSPRPPLRYSLQVTGEGYVFAVSGRMDPQSFAEFGRRQPYTSGSAEGAQRAIERLVDDSAIERSFSRSDVEAYWLAEIGRATLYYRPSDEVFTLVVVGLERQRRQFFPQLEG